MRKRMNIVHVYVKESKKDYYYVSGAAVFDDPEVQPLMGMAYKTFRKHKYGLAEPYENEHVIVKRGILLGHDKEEESPSSFLHPHLSVFDIVLHCIQDFFGIGNAHDLEIHIPELDREEHVVLPGDQDGAIVDLGADFEADAIVREEDELGGVPDPQHLRVV